MGGDAVAALPSPVSTGSGSKGLLSIPIKEGYPWRPNAIIALHPLLLV